MKLHDHLSFPIGLPGPSGEIGLQGFKGILFIK
jgi:hypothetical protein